MERPARVVVTHVLGLLPSLDKEEVPSSSGVVTGTSVGIVQAVRNVLAQADPSVDSARSPSDLLEIFAGILTSALGELCQAIEGDLDPSFALSIMHLRGVYSAIELLWCIGMQSAVFQHAGFQLPKVALASSMLLPKGCIHDLDAVVLALAEPSALIKRVDVFQRLITNDLFAAMMLPRNFDRLLLSLFVITTHPPYAAHRDQHAATLFELAGSDRYKSMVVSKLRSFSSGPEWLRGASTAVLRQILEGHQGVLSVLTGYLDGMVESPHFSTLQSQVAKMIAAVPKGRAADQYYALLAPQLVELLHKAISVQDRALVSNIVSIIHQMAALQPKVTAEMVVRPLVGPLSALFATPTPGLETDAVADANPNSGLLVSVEEVDKCLRALVCLVTSVPSAPATSLARGLHFLQVPQSLLHCYAALLASRARPMLMEAASIRQTGALQELEDVLRLVLLGIHPALSQRSLWAFLFRPPRAHVVVDADRTSLSIVSGHANENGSSLLMQSPLQLVQALRGDDAEDPGDEWSPRVVDSLSPGLLHRIEALLALFSAIQPVDEERASALLSKLLTVLLEAVLGQPGSNADQDHLVQGFALQALLQAPQAVAALLSCDGTAVLALLATVLQISADRLQGEGLVDAQSTLQEPARIPLIKPPLIVDMSALPPRAGDRCGEDSTLDATLGILEVIVSCQKVRAHMDGGRLKDQGLKAALLGILKPLHLLQMCAPDEAAALAASISGTIVEVCAGLDSAPATSAQLPETPAITRTATGTGRSFKEEVQALDREYLQPLRASPDPHSDAVVLATFGVKQLLRRCELEQAQVAPHLSTLLSALLPLLCATDSFLHLAVIAVLVRLHTLSDAPQVLAALVFCVGAEVGSAVFDADNLSLLSDNHGRPLAQLAAGSPQPVGCERLMRAVGLDVALTQEARTARGRSLACEALQRILLRPGPATASVRYLLQGLVALCVRIGRSRPQSALACGAVDLVLGTVKVEFQGRGEVVEAAEELYLRQSCLSLLSQTLVFLRVAPRQEGRGPRVSVASEHYLQDVLDLALGVLQMETAPSADQAAYRRSALFLLRHLVEHHHESLFASGAEHFGLLTRMLRQAKASMEDSDSRVRAQAQIVVQLLGECTVNYFAIDP